MPQCPRCACYAHMGDARRIAVARPPRARCARCAQQTIAVVDGVLDALEAPQGLLTVTVVEAVNVPRSDLFSEADPYLV